MEGAGGPGYGMVAHGVGPGGFVIGLLVLALMVFAYWRIFQKAGYAGAWGLLAILPVLQIFLLLFLALSRWPAQEHDRRG